MDAGGREVITVFLADDHLLVREGVRARPQRQDDLEVLVTDIRMPPSFQREGIAAAREPRKRHPGTGVVVLSQYDDPEHAVGLPAHGSSRDGYLLKDRLAEGDQLVQAIRSVAAGGTVSTRRS